MDIQGAIVWINEVVLHSKDVAIRRNFLKANFHDGSIRLEYFSTQYMTADVLKKPTQRVLFEIHREKLGILESKMY